MVSIVRKGSTPDALRKDLHPGMHEELAEFFGPKNKANREQQRFTWDAKAILSTKAQLAEEFHYKCAYCERKIPIEEAQIDFFRPRTSARGLNNELADDHYWWLSYEWKNMYYCCQQCSLAKSNWFPVRGERCRVKAPYEKINEITLIIDPCRDDPEQHFYFNENHEMVPVSDNGRITIELLKLNRTALLIERKRTWERFIAVKEIFEPHFGPKRKVPRLDEEIFTILKNHLVEINDESTTHRSIQQYFMVKWMRERWELWNFIRDGDSEFLPMIASQEFIDLVTKHRVSLRSLTGFVKKFDLERRAEKEVGTLVPKNFYNFTIEKIRIRNFKSIEDATIVVKNPTPVLTGDTLQLSTQPWVMLLGENAVGKSSILQAIALALMGAVYFNNIRNFLNIKGLVRHGTKRALVEIIPEGSTRSIGISFSGSEPAFSGPFPPPTFVLAYGSTRLNKQGGLKTEPNKSRIRAMNLFSPTIALSDPERWLVALFKKSHKSKKDKDTFNRVALAFKDLLLLNSGENIYVRDGIVWVKFENRPPAKFEHLSDGYKSVLTIGVDIMKTVLQANTTIETAQGIVIIDELGPHLHPQWKLRVVKSFRNTFRNMQFFVSTHDPLCLKGLREGEVHVLTRDEKGNVKLLDNLPDPSEFGAEQLLSSTFFGLNSTVDEELDKAFDQYYYLLSKLDRNQKEEGDLNKLREDLKGKRHLGNSWREELALEAADKILSEEKKKREDVPFTELHARTEKLLRELWDKHENRNETA